MRQLLIIPFALSLLTTACGGGNSAADVTSTTNPGNTTDNGSNTEKPLDGLPPLDKHTPDANEHLAGGDATAFIFNENAFGQRPPAIASDFILDGNFTSGDHIFRTPEPSGIGPLFNEKTCQGCHLRDGRGDVPISENDPMFSMFLRISDANGNPDPIYGDQLQTFGIESVLPDTTGLPKHDAGIQNGKAVGEAFAFIEYVSVNGTYPDGTAYTLRKPVYKIKDLSYGAFVDDVRFSPRVTPSIFGSGLLESIPTEYITQYQDVNDENGDGVSGRAAYVASEFHQEKQLGRFGYKAANPSVLQQISGAFRGDIGITNVVFTDESCTESQQACIHSADLENSTGQQVDISEHRLALVEFYNRVLAVPARRGQDNGLWQDKVVEGRTLFFDTDCAACHIPRHKTGTAIGSVLGELSITGLTPDASPIEVLSDQVIYPYTDLLLHDMGGQCHVTRELSNGDACTSGAQCLYVQRCEGLADSRPEGDASGTEWKTPPLWGLGLVNVVNPSATFLHDGRARTLEEAILWHGGEASRSLDKFKNLNKNERETLINFLMSL